MSLGKSWQFVGGVGAWPYRFFDALRRGLNRRLVRYLTSGLDRAAHADAGDECSKNNPPRRTLEAGSGTAFATSLLADDAQTTAAVCLDMDLEALRLARTRDARILPVVGDLCRLPFADDAFALAFSSSTLEHLDQPHDALLEMTRVCHRHGRVFVGVPYAFGPLAFQPLIRRSRWGVWIGPVFSRRSLDRLLQQADLRPLGHRRYFWRFFIGAISEKMASPSRDAGRLIARASPAAKRDAEFEIRECPVETLELPSKDGGSTEAVSLREGRA